MQARKVNDYITEYGRDVRVERTGETLTRRPSVHNVYELVQVQDGTHPVHKSETTESFVWVSRGSFEAEDEAREHAVAIAERHVGNHPRQAAAPTTIH